MNLWPFVVSQLSNRGKRTSSRLPPRVLHIPRFSVFRRIVRLRAKIVFRSACSLPLRRPLFSAFSTIPPFFHPLLGPLGSLGPRGRPELSIRSVATGRVGTFLNATCTFLNLSRSVLPLAISSRTAADTPQPPFSDKSSYLPAARSSIAFYSDCRCAERSRESGNGQTSCRICTVSADLDPTRLRAVCSE